MSRIAILTAVKTGWEYLPEAAASVRAQTFADWRWVIGVNGHPPGSGAHRTASAVAGDDLRVTVLDLPDARNKVQAQYAMLDATAAPLVAILDADDLWHPAKLGTQTAFMADDIDVLGTTGAWFGAAGGAIPVKTGRISFEDLLERNHVINSSVLMRRECCQWPNTDGLDDYPLWLDLARQGKVIVNIPSPFCCPEPFTAIRCHANQHFAPKGDEAERIRAKFRTLL